MNRQGLYFDLIQLSISEDVRRALARMPPEKFDYESCCSDFARKYFCEGEAEGRPEGRAAGWAEGRTEGRRETLIRLLSVRFGPLDHAALSRMAAASNVELGTIAERLLVAPTLENALGSTGNRAQPSA